MKIQVPAPLVAFVQRINFAKDVSKVMLVLVNLATLTVLQEHIGATAREQVQDFAKRVRHATIQHMSGQAVVV